MYRRIMSDIEKEARERRERRNETRHGLTSDNTILSPRPPIDLQLQDRLVARRRLKRGSLENDFRQCESNDVKGSESPRFPVPRRSVQYRQQPPYFDDICLPFVECQLNDMKIKALLNTCVMRSIMNKKLHRQAMGIDENKFVPSAFDIARGVPEVAQDVPLDIAGRTVHFNFQIRGNTPDIVLGLDFMTAFNCSIHLGTRTLNLGVDGETVTAKFASSADLLSRSKEII